MLPKILIVDDDIDWISSHKEILELSFPGLLELNFASSAEQALQTIETFKPDLIITDMEMEKIPNNMFAGEYLIKKVQSQYPDIKFIIISGAPDIHKIAQRNNIEAFIEKYSILTYPIKLKLKITELLNIKTEIC